MITFDSKSIASWKERQITAISCIITDSGCAGHKIQIKEERDPLLNYSFSIDSLRVYLRKEDEKLLEKSRITWTGKKWILTSDKINTRCGCGSSFSLKSGNAIQDKIAKIKLIIKEKNEGTHAL